MASTHNIQRGVNIFVYSMKAKNLAESQGDDLAVQVVLNIFEFRH